MDLEAKRLMHENSGMLNGRQMIVKFKKGGRIDSEHLYDSAHIDLESQQAIQAILISTLVPCEGGFRPDVGPSMIGKGFKGFAPWEDLSEFMRKHGFNATTSKLEKPQKSIREEQFNLSIPMRISDVVEQPSGTILVTVEASI